MSRFINIHTHHPAPQHICVVNGEGIAQVELTGNYFSAGLHPWFLERKNLGQSLLAIKDTLVNNKDCIAIGECGLDKLRPQNWPLQVLAFEKLIALANELNVPLILHCVRAHSEVMKMLGAQNNQVPVIFHGYNKASLELAHSITASGHYLSFGKSLMNKSLAAIVPNLPLHKVFFETDDDATIGIEAIYQQAATLWQVDMETLQQQVVKNFGEVFGRGQQENSNE